MFAPALPQPTRDRLFVCLLLLPTVLAVGTGLPPASAQPEPVTKPDTTTRRWWINGGFGTGQTGTAPSVSAGLPLRDHLFVGGRYVRTMTSHLTLAFIPVPSTITWEVGPIVGLVEQGRYGHLSLGSGLTVVGGRRFADPGHKSVTLGVPLDAQAFFTPTRQVGIGVHGYATVHPGDNLLGVSLHLYVRFPR